MSKFNIRMAREKKNWYGFNVPANSFFGTEFFPAENGENLCYDFVYIGEIRYVRKKGRTEKFVKVYLHHHRSILDRINDNNPEIYRGYYKPRWISTTKGSIGEKLLSKTVKPDYSEKKREEIRVANLQDFSSAVRRPNSKGALYAMVRNGQ